MKFDEIKQWYIQKQKIYFVSLELTQNCNFQCKHCYCSEKRAKNLSLNDWKVIIDKVYDTGCLFLNFTGGEIMMYEFFEEIYTYAKQKGFIIDLLTNASLIDEKKIELFKKLPPNNIAITIYGTNEKDYLNFTGNKNNYHKVINALELLKKNNIPFVLRTLATKTLKESLAKGDFDVLAQKFATSFKYDVIIFPKTTGNKEPLNESLTVDEIIELEKNNLIRKNAWQEEIIKMKQNVDYAWTCNAGVNSFAVDFQGNAFVCGLYREKSVSILEKDMDSVLAVLHDIHKKHIQIVEANICSKCENRKICKWCPAYAQLFNNDDVAPVSFFCNLAKERVKAFG